MDPEPHEGAGPRYTLNRFEEPSTDVGAGFNTTQLGFPASFASQLEVPSFPRITGFAGDFGTGQAGNYTNNTHHIWAANLSTSMAITRCTTARSSVGRGKHFGQGMSKLLDAFVGGWEMTGIYSIQSGVPVVFGTGSFFSGKSFALPRGQQSLDKWFDTSQFLPFPTSTTTQATLASYPAIVDAAGAHVAPPRGIRADVVGEILPAP